MAKARLEIILEKGIIVVEVNQNSTSVQHKSTEEVLDILRKKYDEIVLAKLDGVVIIGLGDEVNIVMDRHHCSKLYQAIKDNDNEDTRKHDVMLVVQLITISINIQLAEIVGRATRLSRCFLESTDMEKLVEIILANTK
jgi:hypothetical protein